MPSPRPLPPPETESSPPESPVDDFDALFRRFAPYVARTALRIVGRKSEVDDIVQDVFIQAMNRLPQVRDLAAIKGWFATITVRVCSRRLRRRRYRQWFKFAQITDIEAPTADEEQRVALINLYNLLDELPPDQRVAWAVRHIAGEQLEDAASICGCSLATVKRRIAAAQVKLDAKLREA
jgi:RNA polymerase sigma-70 factor (ECF subfamily)